MTGRTLLLFSVLLAISAAVPFPDPRYRNAQRISQRRLGPAPPGDYPNQSFEEYLASNGVSFDSLFEEPAPLRPEAPPAGGRRVALFDALPDRPLPGQRTYAPPQAPRTDLRPGSQSLFRDEPGSQSLYRDEPGSQPLYRDEPVRRRPEPVTERSVRPTQRPLRRVIELKPAPAVADETGQESRQQLIPFIDTERSQPAAESRQGDDYSFSVPPKKEKQRLEFHVHGQEGPHSYRFGYDTGTGYNRQFRFEERDGHGNTKGRYGFYDKSGKLQVVNYSASPHGGFHAEAGH